MSDEHSKPPPEDALSEGPPSGHDDEAPEVEDVEFDEALSGLEEIEASRRTKGVIMGVGALVLLGLSLFAIVRFRTLLFRPDLPIAEQERELLDKTDDPECRQMIAKVGEVRRAFFSLEPEIEQVVPGGSTARRAEVAGQVDALITQLDEAESLSHRATYRHDHTSSEVDRWFGYTRGRLVEIRDLVDPDATTASDAGRADVARKDAGGAQSDGGGGADAGTADGGADTISSRRNDLLFTTHNTLDQFRVWHSSERFAHPCGSADEMEEPWRPGPDASVGGGGSDGSSGTPALQPASGS